MRLYLLSFVGGLAAGVLYALLQIRSPAPPVVALLGLLGMLLGEQAVPAMRRLAAGHGVTRAWLQSHLVPHVFGHLPTGRRPHDQEPPT